LYRRYRGLARSCGRFRCLAAAVVLARKNTNIASMDAPSLSASPTFATRTPLHIGAVALTVRDLDKVASYYRDLLGLTELARSAGSVELGVGGVTLIELIGRRDAKVDDPREAGLYHTAFLMPRRADLARWIEHIARARTPVTGASDHGVSEAIYLDDPEGNGVEVYADRLPEAWTWQDGLVRMPTERLDVEDLVRAAHGEAEYGAAPAGLRVGHIHLRVGDLGPAARFYQQAIGLEPTRQRGGALFMSSGGYHHHVATNVWHSQGAGARDADRAGLAWFEIRVADEAALAAAAERLRAAGAPLSRLPEGFETADPWGTHVRLVRANGA
jgi:catechol 2,3-dioxygenase